MYTGSALYRQQYYALSLLLLLFNGESFNVMTRLITAIVRIRTLFAYRLQRFPGTHERTIIMIWSRAGVCWWFWAIRILSVFRLVCIFLRYYVRTGCFTEHAHPLYSSIMQPFQIWIVKLLNFLIKTIFANFLTVCTT